MNAQIELPEANELDTGGPGQTTGFRVALYLVPAEENDGEKPRVTTHSGYGNIGSPMPAFHSRWVSIASYGPQVVGSSVLELLEKISDVLVAYAERYEGTEWDGSNHKGQWDLEDPYALKNAWEDNDHIISHYWEASDWFGPAGINWEELCDEAAIDPKRAFDEDVTALAELIEENIQDQQDQLVTGTAYYAEMCAEEYLDNHNRCT